MPTKTYYYDFEVSLIGVEPRIWRRFLLRMNCDFHELHDTIQKACGWQDYHLYEFREWVEGESWSKRKTIATSPYSEPEEIDEVMADARQVKLGDVIGFDSHAKLVYEYDFGDGWEHLIEVKDIQQLAGTTRRKLIAGERAFPPEDCGGILGYEEAVEAFHMTKAQLAAIREEDERDEIQTIRTWLGDWEPEKFDFDMVADLMKRPVRYPEPY